MCEETHGVWERMCYENGIKTTRLCSCCFQSVQLIRETLSTLRWGARMLVNWPVNQIGLSLEPDKGSIIYQRRKKKSERNVIIFLFSRACGDEDSDDYWILSVFYYTPELWGAGEGCAAPREVHPFGGVGARVARCGVFGVGCVCLPLGNSWGGSEMESVKRAAGIENYDVYLTPCWDALKAQERSSWCT